MKEQFEKAALLGLVSALSVTGLIACSASVTAPAAVSIPGPSPQEISQKAVQGQWKTSCQADGGMNIVEKMNVAGRDLEIVIEFYSNSKCSGTPTMTQKVVGNFDILGASNFISGGWDVDVTVINGDGKKEITPAAFLIESGVLYFSNDSKTTPGQRPSQIDRNKPYFRVGG